MALQAHTTETDHFYDRRAAELVLIVNEGVDHDDDGAAEHQYILIDALHDLIDWHGPINDDGPAIRPFHDFDNSARWLIYNLSAIDDYHCARLAGDDDVQRRDFPVGADAGRATPQRVRRRPPGTRRRRTDPVRSVDADEIPEYRGRIRVHRSWNGGKWR